jgi:hypothetical protein
MSNIANKNLESIYTNIKNVLDEARNKAVRSVNFAMVQAYWHIGRLIVEEEQSGKERADYGESLIEELSKRLTTDYGKGFNRTNLRYMRQFYLMFKNHHALRDELTWTHYRFLLKVENESARELESQINDYFGFGRIKNIIFYAVKKQIKAVNYEKEI